MREKIVEILKDIDEEIVSYDGESLIEEGLVDSFTIMEILTDIEDQLGVKIPDEKILPESFVSIDKIVELVEKYG